MIELPGSLRDLLCESIDEELENSGADEPDGWIRCVFIGLDSAAEELDEDLQILWNQNGYKWLHVGKIQKISGKMVGEEGFEAPKSPSTSARKNR